MTASQWPNFFIVGAAKCGTTSLYEYLSEHPQVFMSSVKEPHFFSQVIPDPMQRHVVRPIRDRKRYLALFDGVGSAKAVGEASPSYLSERGTAQRIHSECPNSRIIIILRDPIQRAYSHYLMDCRKGWQDAPFLEAVQNDFAAERKGWGISHMYIELGLYAENVAQYIDIFGRDKVLVLLFDDLTGKRIQTLEGVAQFLEIDPEAFPSHSKGKIHNPHSTPRFEWSRRLLQGNLKNWFGVLIPSSFRAFLRDRLLLKVVPKPPIDPEAVAWMRQIYDMDLLKLERVLEKPLPTLRGGR